MGKHFAAEAALTVPLGMAINSLFLLVFITVSQRGLLVATSISLTAWAFLAISFRFLSIQSTALILVIYLFVLAISYVVLEHKLKVESVSKRNQPFKWQMLVYRALFAGTVVALTVIVSRFAGHFWTGIFSTFPAVMLTSMVILTRSQGIDFAKATAKTMILASGNIVVYALSVNYLYSIWSLGVATLVAFLLSALFLIAIYPFLRRTR